MRWRTSAPGSAGRWRARRTHGSGGDNGLGAREHAELPGAAGFEAVGTVWQYGHSVVMAAVRA
ncbi:hypothetical protein ACFY7C_04685 [Streptomyces sp. NPDC012769]|uniref:hypothetical protein n=1 Tax=Streptomyces sp. NPDC012769 TaxID=3364848 RepID=UPI003681AF9C